MSATFRLLAFRQGGAAALDALKRGLVHLAGSHRSTVEGPGRNAEAAQGQLDDGLCLLRAAQWVEGWRAWRW